MTKKKIYIAYTGGTIGMKKTSNGYAPEPGYIQTLMANMPELKDPSMPEYTINEYNPLLDSANMNPDDWLKIARDIQRNYHEYDGFIVMHGTDTMAYTASALPFMFEGLHKPVILTGSQIPLCEVRNDARENIITTLQIASGYPINSQPGHRVNSQPGHQVNSQPVHEVCLYFNNQLLRGCRSVKANADGFDAFASPNFPPLGRVGINIDIKINDKLLYEETGKDTDALKVRELGGPIVGALRLFPGISSQLLKNALQPPLMGLVLEAFGVGNGPDRNKEFMKAIKEAVDNGIVIVDCSQCLRGSVNLGGYATGASMAKAGVIPGYDMTTEAALAKLYYLFKQGYPVEEVKAKMVTNMRGELTVPIN